MTDSGALIILNECLLFSHRGDVRKYSLILFSPCLNGWRCIVSILNFANILKWMFPNLDSWWANNYPNTICRIIQRYQFWYSNSHSVNMETWKVQELMLPSYWGVSWWGVYFFSSYWITCTINHLDSRLRECGHTQISRKWTLFLGSPLSKICLILPYLFKSCSYSVFWIILLKKQLQ